jgi:hypothetical protein
MAFMDMLETGIGSLTLSESRAHFALWVIMAQPLHLGLDIRNMSDAMRSVIANREGDTIALSCLCTQAPPVCTW